MVANNRLGLTMDDPEFRLDRVEFGPFDEHQTCMKEYGGINETCTNEATIAVVFESEKEDEYWWFTCDDHTFPFLREQRIQNEIGYPPKCQTCRAAGRFGPNRNETDGVALFATEEDNEYVQFYTCETCAEDGAVTDLTPVEEIDDHDEVASISV